MVQCDMRTLLDKMLGLLEILIIGSASLLFLSRMPTTPRARSLKACSSRVIIFLVYPGQIQCGGLRVDGCENPRKDGGGIVVARHGCPA